MEQLIYEIYNKKINNNTLYKFKFDAMQTATRNLIEACLLFVIPIQKVESFNEEGWLLVK